MRFTLMTAGENAQRVKRILQDALLPTSEENRKKERKRAFTLEEFNLVRPKVVSL